jgi:hypothetical protein
MDASDRLLDAADMDAMSNPPSLLAYAIKAALALFASSASCFSSSLISAGLSGFKLLGSSILAILLIPDDEDEDDEDDEDEDEDDDEDEDEDEDEEDDFDSLRALRASNCFYIYSLMNVSNEPDLKAF